MVGFSVHAYYWLFDGFRFQHPLFTYQTTAKLARLISASKLIIKKRSFFKTVI
jgi:hypothetical protein